MWQRQEKVLENNASRMRLSVDFALAPFRICQNPSITTDALQLAITLFVRRLYILGLLAKSIALCLRVVTQTRDCDLL